MDNKQAIIELKCLQEDYWEDDGYGHETKEYEDTISAIDKAIASLEAWDKVVEEINELIQGDNGVEHIQVGEKRALNIIEKYKKEIEE